MIGADVTFVSDTSALDAAIEKSASAVIFEMGANIVNTVDRSLQYKRGSSRPGQPPHVHRSNVGGASPLKSKLGFAMENPLHVVAGVERAGRGGLAPRQLEEGAAITSREGKRLRIAPRPYMRPGHELEMMKVPGNFADIF